MCKGVFMNVKNYNFGQVGYRGRGKGLASFVVEAKGAQLVALADLVGENLEDAKSLYSNINVYSNHLDMIEAENLDVLIIATAPKFRLPIVTDAVQKGVKAIYMEKPIANTLAEADQMISLCKDNGVELSIGHQRRWDPNFVNIKNAIKNGDLGTITHGVSYWTAGRIGANGTHFLDMINFVLDDEPIRISGISQFGMNNKADFNESLNEWMEKDPGVSGFIDYSRGTRIWIHCFNDVITPHTHMFCGTKGRIDVFEGMGKFDMDILYRASDKDSTDMRDVHIVEPKQFPVVTVDKKPESLAYEELIRVFSERKNNSSTGEDGRKALEMIVAFQLSSENGGRSVSLPLPESCFNYEVGYHPNQSGK
tara:strand:- start:17 stop:1114 length:1098 start_codon:yes stop_codon:yes gene_type:complete